MANSKLKPLIKYTGGKFNEYKYFSKDIPPLINDYYEPFFGGGGVLFQLKNDNRIQGNIYINDKSEDLMSFYSNICDESFKTEIQKISKAWDEVSQLGKNIFNTYGEIFFNIIIKKDDITKLINDSLYDFIAKSIKENKSLSEYYTHGFSLTDEIYNGLKTKTKRFINKTVKENDTELSHKSITTSVCQSFYFVIRNMYNEWNTTNTTDYTEQEKSAHWFFIREFCFGAMFRFSNGKFNIPYGGYGYNKKCFKCKIDQITSKKNQALFSEVNISSKDFSYVLNRKFNDDDFIFIDPPYDGTFTEYDNNSFDKEDHIRLKKCLDNVNGKWLIVIRKSDFISQLYSDYYQEEFNKTYMYQAKGKYDNKNSIHLIIKNF